MSQRNCRERQNDAAYRGVDEGRWNVIVLVVWVADADEDLRRHVRVRVGAVDRFVD
jgi:hypothetical protein